MKLASSFSLAALIAALLLCGLQPAQAGQFVGPYYSYGTPVGDADSADGTGDMGSSSVTVAVNNQPLEALTLTATGLSSFETDISNIYGSVTLDVPNFKVYYVWQPAYPGDTMPTDFSNPFIQITLNVTNSGSEYSAPGVPPPSSSSNDGAVECGFGTGTATGDVGEGNEAASYTLYTAGSSFIIGNNQVSTTPTLLSGGIYPVTAGQE